MVQQRFYDVDIGMDLQWSNEVFGENFNETNGISGDIVLVGGVAVGDHRWLQWYAVEGALHIAEGSKVNSLQDASICLRFEGLPLQAACFVDASGLRYTATMIIATSTSIITLSMQSDASTSLLATAVDFNQGSAIVLHAPGFTHDFSHFLRVYPHEVVSPLSASVTSDAVLYGLTSGDIVRCTIENNTLQCRSLREAGLLSLYGLLSTSAPPPVALAELAGSETITVNASGQISLPNGSISLAQLWGVAARDPWVSNVTLTTDDVLLVVDATEEIMAIGIRLVYRGQTQWKIAQVNIATGVVTPVLQPFGDGLLLDMCFNNSSLFSLWQASSVYVVQHSTPEAYTLYKTRDEYGKTARREDEALFRAIAAGAITDMSLAKNLWCRRLMQPHRFTQNPFHPSQLASCASLAALNETCLEVMTGLQEAEEALPVRIVVVNNDVVLIRPNGASCILAAQSTLEDAVLNMVVPLSESLLEMDTFVIQTMWGKNYFDTDSLESILSWCRSKSPANQVNPGATLERLSVLPDVTHVPPAMRGQMLRHIIQQYYAVAKIICMHFANTPQAHHAATTMLYYACLLALGELRTNTRNQLNDIECSDLLLLDVTTCSVPKDASPLWEQIILNTSGDYCHISTHNAIIGFLAKYGPYSMLTRILSLFKITQPQLEAPVSSSYQQHVSFLTCYFDYHFITRSMEMANFQIAVVSNTNIEKTAQQLLEESPFPALESHGEPARSIIDGDVVAVIRDDIRHWYDDQSSKYAAYCMLMKLAHQPLFQQYYASYYHTTSTLQYMITYTPSIILHCAMIYQQLNTLFLLHRASVRVSNVHALESCYRTLAYLDRMESDVPAMLDIYAMIHSHVVTYCMENSNYSNCWASIIALINLHREKSVDNNWQMLLKSFLHQVCKHNIAWLCSLHADPVGLPGYLHAIIGDELEKLASSLDVPRCVLYYDSLVAYWVSCAEYREVARVMYQLAGRLRFNEHAELLKRCLVTATAALSLLPQAQQFIVLRQQDVSMEKEQRQLQAVSIRDLRYEYIVTLCREQCSVYYENDVDVMQQLCSYKHFLLALQLQAVSKQQQECKRVLMHHLTRHMVTADASPVEQFLSVIPAGVLFRHLEDDYSNVQRIIVQLLQSKEYCYDCVAEVFSVIIHSPARNELVSELVQIFCGVQDGEAKYCGSNLQILLLLLLKAGRLTEACVIASTIIYSIPAHQHNTIPYHIIDQVLSAVDALKGTDAETQEARKAADALKGSVKNYFANLCLVEAYDSTTA